MKATFDRSGLIKSRPFYRKYLVLSALLFTVLLLGILGLVGYLSFKTLSEEVFTDIYGASLKEGLRIADRILQEHAAGGGALLKGTTFRTIIRTYVDDNLYLTEQYDRIVISNARGGVLTHLNFKQSHYAVQEPDELKVLYDALGGDPLHDVKQVLEEKQLEARVPVSIGDNQTAYIDVAPSEAQIEQRLAALRRELIYKLLFGALLSCLLLGIAVYFVVRLLHKSRRLEAEAQQADRLAYVGTLAGGLAHEIRNPLNAMGMNVQMLQEDLSRATGMEIDRERLDLLRETHNEIRRLERLVNEFMMYARPSKPSFEKRDIKQVITSVVEFLKVGHDQEGLRIELDIPDGLPPVEIDEDQMRQALINLLSNAFQAVDGAGKVSVQVETWKSDHVEISISDTGPGISSKDLDRVFEVFYSTKRGGSGLGLPIARRIIESHRASIVLDSRPGRGTHTRILLPLKQALE